MLRFVFPFDRSLSRTASLFWRSTHPKVDTWYADITQGGDSAVVHEQVTFPGDAWVVYAKESPDKVLAYHVATGEREQRVVVTGEVAAPLEQPRQPTALTATEPSALSAVKQEDKELAAAIRESLEPRSATFTSGGGSSTAAAAAAVGRRERQEVLEAAGPMATAAVLLGPRLRPDAPQPAEAEAQAEGDTSLSRAVALSRELAAAHRAVEAARRSWLAAATVGEDKSGAGAGSGGGGGGGGGSGGGGSGGGSGAVRVRLQLTLPDGTRSAHDARPDTPLRSAPSGLDASVGLGLSCSRTPWPHPMASPAQGLRPLLRRLGASDL